MPLQWNQTQLNCIRKHVARPTVHARNLFHCSLSMYDAWAVYDATAEPFLLGNTWGNFFCPFNGIAVPDNESDRRAAQEEAMSYAMYRTLKSRYLSGAPAANYLTILGYIETQMDSLGYDETITSTDYSDGDPAKLGNYIAAKIQEFALQDGSNQQFNYANQYYSPINGVLAAQYPGNPYCEDPNRWQPLYLSVCTDQSTPPIVIPCSPTEGTPALSHEWGNVTPFSLRADQATDHYRDGNLYRTYLDPGAPPYLDTLNWSDQTTSMYKWGFVMNIIWHSFHNNDDGVMIDASPNSVGGLNFTDISQLPQTFEDYQNFYNLMQGGVDDPGHTINPATGAPYEVQMVPRKDFTRVLSQYWADGPSSETPPGHWFKLFNDVSANPLLEKRWMGEGEILDDMDWYVRGYFTVGAGVHDAAIACWGAKGYYDYTRPIMAIRWMGSRGQCTDSTLSNYHPAGLPLIPGYIEVVNENDPLALADPTAINKIKVFSWRGPVAATGEDGAGWLLAERWWTYQAATFVTPPFAGYYSGHSTYSRTAAEIMTLITGDEYFPGGMAEYDAPPGYLIADSGPSVEVKLQWATYRDASDQCSLSRIYGGLHPPQDDIPGRITGLIVGPQVVTKANEYILANLVCDNDADLDGVCDEDEIFACIDSLACNYNAFADSADGSCVYPGCTDETACNYDPLAGCDDGTCNLPGCPLQGFCNYDPTVTCIEYDLCIFSACSDSLACNYDPLSQCDDGNTCTYGIAGCTIPFACNYNPEATCFDGSCGYSGCMDSTACNYDPAAICSNGNCIFLQPYYNCSGWCVNDSDGDFVCDELEVVGCGDPLACNYNPLASDSSYDCYFQLEYRNCDGTCQNDADNDNVCDQQEINGCTDPGACNYNPYLQNEGDNSCTYPGCNISNACNYNAAAGCDDSSCVMPGCMNTMACNYDPDAGCADNSCLIPANMPVAVNCWDVFVLDSAQCLWNNIGVQPLPPFVQCYETATFNDSTCSWDVSGSQPLEPERVNCWDHFEFNSDSCDWQNIGEVPAMITISDTLTNEFVVINDNVYYTAGEYFDTLYVNGYCATIYNIIVNNPLQIGCLIVGACNYDLFAGINDSSLCFFPGCVDVDACNYDSDAGCSEPEYCHYDVNTTVSLNLVDNDFVLYNDSMLYQGVYEFTYQAFNGCDSIVTVSVVNTTATGCLIVGACNYDPTVGINDSSLCTYPGCIEMTACNYEATASCDNGTCVFPGCDDAQACNYDALVQCADSSVCIFPDGCTDSMACNFNPFAVCDNGTCGYDVSIDIQLYLDSSGSVLFNDSTLYQGIYEFSYLTAEGCDSTVIVSVIDSSASGCLIVGACNYDPTVGINDSSLCTYPGCLELTACNYDADAGCNAMDMCNLPDGCNDASACNFNIDATCNDGSCIYANACGDCFGVEGCTDIAACNFDINATCDDASCLVITSAEIAGELNVNGDTFNYQYPVDPSHLINWFVNGGGAIISGQGTGSIQVVWQASGTLCAVESVDADCVGDSVCVDVVYSGVEEVAAADFTLYPNPSVGRAQVQLNGPSPLPFVVFDALGNEVLHGTLVPGINDLNMEFLVAGSYMIRTQATHVPLIIVK